MNPIFAESRIYQKSEYIDQCIKTMKDISKMPSTRRKRKHSTESWTTKYKQLEIFILKDAKKKEEPKKESASIAKSSKKRRAISEVSYLANAAFPDDLDVSFYQGEISDVSFSMNLTANDHVVPDASAKLSVTCQDLEDPLVGEKQIIKSDNIGKMKPSANKGKNLSSIKENKYSSFKQRNPALNILKTPLIQPRFSKATEQFMFSAYVQKLVPQTPCIPPQTPYFGNNHRQNSGFSVPETPAFFSNNKIPIVTETPMLQHR